MDDDYIVRWVIKQVTLEGVVCHAHEEICDDLTTAERYFTRLIKHSNILEARILWGNVIIKNYRRDKL